MRTLSARVRRTSLAPKAENSKYCPCLPFNSRSRSWFPFSDAFAMTAPTWKRLPDRAEYRFPNKQDPHDPFPDAGADQPSPRPNVSSNFCRQGTAEWWRLCIAHLHRYLDVCSTGADRAPTADRRSTVAHIDRTTLVGGDRNPR